MLFDFFSNNGKMLDGLNIKILSDSRAFIESTNRNIITYCDLFKSLGVNLLEDICTTKLENLEAWTFELCGKKNKLFILKPPSGIQYERIKIPCSNVTHVYINELNGYKIVVRLYSELIKLGAKYVNNNTTINIFKNWYYIVNDDHIILKHIYNFPINKIKLDDMLYYYDGSIQGFRVSLRCLSYLQNNATPITCQTMLRNNNNYLLVSKRRLVPNWEHNFLMWCRLKTENKYSSNN
jgi:hypothetical protein